MNRLPFILLIGAYFFIYTLYNLNSSYDRVVPQILVLSFFNLISFSYLILKYSITDLYNLLRKKNTILLYLGFIIVSGISIIIANNKAESLITFSTYLTFFLSLISIFLIVKKQELDIVNIFLVFCLGSVIIDSISILFSLVQDTIVEGNTFSRGNTYRGLTANINISAFMLTMKSPVIIYFLLKYQKNRLKVWLLSLVLLMVVISIFILLSRGAFIAFAISTFLLILYFFIKSINRKFFIPAIYLAVIVVGYFISSSLINSADSNIINDRVSSINIDREDDSIDERLRFYSAAVKSISKNPILGIGIGNWKIETIRYDAKNLEGYRVANHAHNDFLQVTAESGFLALLFYLGFIIYPYIFYLKKEIYKESNHVFYLILIMMSVYIIDSMLNFPISRPVSHIFLVFILIVFMKLKEVYEKQVK